MVLHQEPSASEAISPRVARPYIQALHSINLDAQQEDQQQQKKEEEEVEQEELAGKDATEDDQELESQVKEEPAHKEELNAVMEQVALYCLGNKNKYKKQECGIRSVLALAILVTYARRIWRFACYCSCSSSRQTRTNSSCSLQNTICTSGST